ncbi:MAG: hypothetical protein JWM44_2096 [Bacilli bacterium]|nr:hypothetical protein [Bacilli bacterium]
MRKNISILLIVIFIISDFFVFQLPKTDASNSSIQLTSSDYPASIQYGSGIYNRASSLSFSKSFAIPDVQTASININSVDYPCSVTATNINCVINSVNGSSKQVKGQNHFLIDTGGFDWWRNGAGGAHSYWWSADYSGSTQYADNNGVGGCGIAPCSNPGTNYGIWQNTGVMEVDASADTFTGATDNVNYDVVVGSGWTKHSSSGPVIRVNMGPITNGKSNVTSTEGGPFNYDASCGGSPYGCSYIINYEVLMEGTTYEYANNAVLSYTLNGQPTPTPTVTPVGATPTPVPTPTPTPVPTCSTPVSISESIPPTAKSGQNFFVSGSGSKDSTGGTNLSYQWYYQDVSGGTLYTGPSTRDATLNITTESTFKIFLGIIDNNRPICSAQTNQTITVTPPKPDADVAVTGKFEINRALVIDSSNSSSPSSYPITSRNIAIAPLNGAVSTDIVTLESLSGTTKVDMMLRKPGDYNVSNTVCNSLGLCDTKTIIITIIDDLPPIGTISGASTFYRDPANGGAASVNLTGSLSSPDGDTIASSNVKIVYDNNNDGNFADNLAANSFAGSFNSITGALSFSASAVGKYLVILSGCESFDPGLFASYLTAADYKCTNPAISFIVTIDNQAPTTSLSGLILYKADIAFNIGNLSASDQNYFRNNINAWKTTLLAKNVDVNITTATWNPNFEPDYLKDSGAFLGVLNWRSNLDQKYFIGVTNTVNTLNVGSTTLPLNLKPIAVSSTQFEGPIISGKATGHNVSLLYQYSWGGGNYNFTFASGTAGSALTKQDTGGQYTTNNAYPYNSFGSLGKDYNGNAYVIMGQSISNPDNTFYHTFKLFSPALGAMGTPMTGVGSGTSQYNQIFSQMSDMSGGPTLWSTSGIFYMQTWQQNGNYFRNASNGWSPSPYGSSGYDVYNVGYYAGGDYWFGSTGTMNSNYLFMSYNGTRSYYPNYYSNINYAYTSGNTITVFVTSKSYLQYKLVFTNGTLTSEVQLTNIPSNASITTGNGVTGKLYLGSNAGISQYDYINNKVDWTKAVPSIYTIQDITFDSDGITPLYLFSSSLTNMYYLSKDGDTTVTANDTMISKSTANSTVSYNEAGTYAWYELDSSSGSNRTQLYKINKMDSDGIYSYSIVPKSSTATLYGLHVMANNDIMIVGYDSSKGYYYALKSESFNIHYQQSYGFSGSSTGLQTFYADANDNVGFTASVGPYPGGGLWGYKINLANHSIDYVSNLPFQSVITNADGSHTQISDINTKVINNQLHKVTNRYDTTPAGNSTLTMYADGIQMYNSFYLYSNAGTSIDANTNGNFFATAIVTKYPNSQTLFATNLPGYPTNGSILYGYSQVTAKFVNNVPYIYAKLYSTSNVEIYRVDPNTSYLKTTLIGYLQNTNVFPTGWVGNSNYVFNADYTNLPTSRIDTGIPIYPESINLNGYDSIIPETGTYSSYANGEQTRYDNTTGGFAKIVPEYANTNIFDGYFYDSVNNQYVKQVHTSASAVSYLNFSYANGGFLFGDYHNGTYGGYSTTNAITAYKMDKNGTTNLYTYTLTDPSKSIRYGSFTQDEAGYTYGIILTGTYNGYSDVGQAYIITNKSGTFQAYPYSISGSSYASGSQLYVNHGELMISLQVLGANYQNVYYMDVTTLGQSTNFPHSLSTISNQAKDFTYDADTKSIFFVQMTYSRNSQGYSVDAPIISYYPTTGSQYALYNVNGGNSYVMDKNYIYTTDSQTIYKFNKYTMVMVDVGRLAPSGKYYALNSKGKFIGFSGSTINVYNGIDMSQTDPTISTLLGGQTIKSVFAGPQAILPTVDYLVTLTNGKYIDNTAFTPQNTFDALTNYIVNDLKQQNAGQTLYYIMGDQLNLQGAYSDYEFDPKQAEKYKCTQNPNIFDNNQGYIANNGQAQSMNLVLDHVGSYVCYYSAQDNPTGGNASLAPYSKWSAEDQPFNFIVHRKPFAVFNVILRTDPNNLANVLFTAPESSYDLDHNISDPVNKGIVSKQWMYKDSSTATWINGLPPSSLPKNISYDLVLTVTDLEGATAKASTTFFTGNTTANNPPVTNITSITSTDPNNPDILSTATPNFMWSYFDADGDPQQRYTLNVYDSSNNIVTTSNEVLSSATSYQQLSALSQNVVYSVQVKAHDGFVYGNLSTKKYFKIILNHPPVGGFDWTPKPVWQGDNISIINQVSDIDHDPLTIQYTITDPNGIITNSSATRTYPYSTVGTTISGAIPGNYTVRQSVSDGIAAAVITTQTITVNANVLNSIALLHSSSVVAPSTLSWEGYRTQLNRTQPTFFAGEPFIASAVTSSNAVSLKVNFQLPTAAYAISSQYSSVPFPNFSGTITTSTSNNINWSGTYYNQSFYFIPDGTYNVVFTATYSNGTTLSQTYHLTILDSGMPLIAPVN